MAPPKKRGFASRSLEIDLGEIWAVAQMMPPRWPGVGETSEWVSMRIGPQPGVTAFLRPNLFRVVLAVPSLQGCLCSLSEEPSARNSHPLRIASEGRAPKGPPWAPLGSPPPCWRAKRANNAPFWNDMTTFRDSTTERQCDGAYSVGKTSLGSAGCAPA